MAEIFKDPRKKEYLNAEGADKPLKSPIPTDTLKRARLSQTAIGSKSD